MRTKVRLFVFYYIAHASPQPFSNYTIAIIANHHPSQWFPVQSTHTSARPFVLWYHKIVRKRHCGYRPLENNDNNMVANNDYLMRIMTRWGRKTGNYILIWSGLNFARLASFSGTEVPTVLSQEVSTVLKHHKIRYNIGYVIVSV